jgi:UDP-N-acetylmuramate-alanine ligase
MLAREMPKIIIMLRIKIDHVDEYEKILKIKYYIRDMYSRVDN